MSGYTDANGKAAVEVLNSDPEVINVIADFDPEGLLRSIDVDIPGPPRWWSFKRAADEEGDHESQTSPTVAGLGRVGPGPHRSRTRRDSARAPRQAARQGYLVVKVKSSTRYAKLRVKVLGKQGRKLSTLAKRVRTNRTVKLRLSAKARSARVSLVR